MLVVQIHHSLTAPCKKSRKVFFASSIMKNSTLLFAPLTFPVKLVCCIASWSASSACCILKSIVIIL